MELKLVPLGLFTAWCMLLIVPYGIETSDWNTKIGEHELLIVPYGIETGSVSPVEFSTWPFNRTLWN